MDAKERSEKIGKELGILEDRIEGTGWSLLTEWEPGHDDWIELEYFCSNGMDYVVTVFLAKYTGDNDFNEVVLHELKSAYAAYDPEEETRTRIDQPGAPSIRQVLDDCDEVADRLSELIDTLE